MQLSARRAVGQAKLMAKEIDHRVMNSLQFVSGLLTMQSRSPGVGEAAAHLKVAANRVAAVAQVHRHFYAGEAAEMSCITFLRRLCDDLASILEREVEVDGDEGNVPTTLIQPIGLLVNELVTNAAKHGKGKIFVAYRCAAGGQMLTVCDEDDGLPPGFDPTATEGSLGMRVVTSLTQQLDGKFTARQRGDGPGACFAVAF